MNRRTQEGVMLIEALIGILIFSIGILALIGMQGTAVKNTTDARYRSEAAYLANRIAGQIRLDMSNVASYHDGSAGAYQPRTDWRAQVEAALPGVVIASNQRVPSIDIASDAALTFAGDTTPSSRATITIWWLQPGETQQRQFQVVTHVTGMQP